MSKKLIEDDFKLAANILDVTVAHIKTVTKVESNGNGFFDNGEPCILFERHIMYRLLKEKNKLPSNNLLVDIIHSKPGAYIGGIEEHDRLKRAVAYDRDCALQSASWGMFQIMGFNYKSCGFNTIQDFINAMYEGENKQLIAFVNFIKNNKILHDSLKKQDWTTFAKNYNGPAYAKNKYDIKLANAFSYFKDKV